jgi:hypothetical protein
MFDNKKSFKKKDETMVGNFNGCVQYSPVFLLEFLLIPKQKS